MNGIVDKRIISYVKEIKLNNLRSRVSITRDLESNCSLIIGKNQY